MATNLDTLYKTQDNLDTKIGSSYVPNTVPTKNVGNMSVQLASVKKQIEDAKSTALKNEWYGKATDADTVNTGVQKDGLLMGGLKALQKPLNVIAGTAQYALGKGTESSLAENVNTAMKTGLTFGNVLNQVGVKNRLVSGGLGFMLDVGLDPVNWLTMGTAAFVPRVAAGLVKGGLEREALTTGLKGITGYNIKKGLEAAGEGAVSNLAKTGSDILNFIPGVKSASKIGEAADLVAKAGGEGISGWKNIVQKAAKGITDTSESLAKRAVTGSEKYDALMGTNLYSKLNKGMFGMPTGIIGETVEKFVSKIPSVKIGGMVTPTGKAIVDFFKYSPTNAAKIADLKDQITNLGKEAGINLTHSKEGLNFFDVDEVLKKGGIVNVESLTKEVSDSVIHMADEAGNVLIKDNLGKIIPEFQGKIRVQNTTEVAKSLLGTAIDQVNIDHLNKVYKEVKPGMAGVDWYDNLIIKTKETRLGDMANFVRGKVGMDPIQIEKEIVDMTDQSVGAWNTMNGVTNKMAKFNPAAWKPFEATLTGLENFISIFKLMKVPLNPGSHIVARVGNFFMGAMMGLPVYKPEYMSSLMSAEKLLNGKLGINGIKQMFFNDTNLLITMADENPARFRQLFGFDPSEIVGKIDIENKIMGAIPTKMEDAAKFLQKTFEEVTQANEEVIKIMQKEGKISALGDLVTRGAETELGLSKIVKKSVTEKMGTFPTASESEKVFKKLQGGTITEADKIGTFTTEELNAKLFEKTKTKIAEATAANPNNLAYKLADKIINGMPKWYEHVDQTFKIGTVDYMTRVGLTEQELLTINRTVKFAESDILEPIIENGQKLYRLKPLKASEVAMETYMNYAAMPDFVKMMRALPIIGSNFYSFQYAMAIKMGKTAIANLSAYNKIGFMLNEITGTRSPEEKIALEDKYNQYINSPTVVKMFGQWNVNVKNMIPIYGMNMFNPSEKTYSDTPQGNTLKVLDTLPILQTPIGQVLKDYWIQPWMLSGTGDVPQGQFGQALYPNFDDKGNLIEADLKTKLFYGTRTLGEAVVPGVASYLGLPLGYAGISPELTNLIPSYGIRGIAGATQGRSSIGVMTKEDTLRKTWRTVLGRTGIPLYPLDTTRIDTTNLK